MSIVRTYSTVEVFGPTIQGEGPSAGERCWFLRLGGCDYRCSWCDTMYAVEPAEVRKAPKLTPEQICKQLGDLGFTSGDLLVVSGGNPALHDLRPLLATFMQRAWAVRLHAETQGTKWRPWLYDCELVVVSPKPPSAIGEDDAYGKGLDAFRHFLANFETGTIPPSLALKVVAFDDDDLDWCEYAASVAAGRVDSMWLSAGTDQTAPDLAQAAVERFRWLCNRALERPLLRPYRVGLQQHVLVWPGEKGR